jgi:hypothetical protein
VSKSDDATKETVGEVSDEVQSKPVKVAKAEALTAEHLAENIASQRKVQTVFAVLLGIMFVWLAFISARMYAVRDGIEDRGFMMNHSQQWGESSSGNSSGQFR